ncbi:hypothetical protein [Frankia sp. R43]|uniref:hypothetical protein n=1 Tax=Frankia sp. R43 TaxID=269536 RepID=UPI000A77A47E|nr:hypothetical protein [Frankia sp. R43]
MTSPVWRAGVPGRILSGEYEGRSLLVERDRAGTGWRIYITEQSPGVRGEGWDVWADDEHQIEEWIRDFGAIEWERPADRAGPSDFGPACQDGAVAPVAPELAPGRVLRRMLRSPVLLGYVLICAALHVWVAGISPWLLIPVIPVQGFGLGILMARTVRGDMSGRTR